jgi:hypothetical protein
MLKQHKVKGINSFFDGFLTVFSFFNVDHLKSRCSPELIKGLIHQHHSMPAQ